MELEDKVFWRYHLIRELQIRWKRAGHRVAIHPAADRLPGADLAVLHVDRSVTPPEYLAAVRSYPRTINARVSDIRKRNYSTLLLRPTDGYAGPVIVKTDLNSGGRPEAIKRGAALRLGRKAGPPVRAIEGDYPVFASIAEVPAAAWTDPDLVVEKFVPGPGPDGYCLHYCYFLGEAVFNVRVHSAKPYIRSTTMTRAEEVLPPDQFGALRRKFGFDYGKFDYVVRDGELVLLDLNRTPALGLLEKQGLLEAAAERLGPGIEGLLG